MDEHETTGVYERVGLAWLPRWLRGRLTPTTLWLAIGALAAGIGYVGKAQVKLDRHQESITDLQLEHAQDRDLLQKMNTQLAVMNRTIDDIAEEVNRQRDWREKIQEQAEAPPHARRRTR